MANVNWRENVLCGRMETLLPRDAGLARSALTGPSFPPQIGVHHCGSPTNLIGLPHHFTAGQFSGQTVRAQLHELQRPKFGRRFGAVDRRALDDPPAVLLRLFNVYNAGTEEQWEQEVQNYNEIQLPGLLCMADLFEIPRTVSPLMDSITPSSPNHICVAAYKLPSDTLVLVDGSPVTAGSKRTTALFGSKFIEPHKIGLAGRNQNQKQIIFTFSDLAVRLEGNFILRYRFLDIFSSPCAGGSAKILAECYGGPFKMYSSKEAPSLKESTTLTKCLSYHGVPVKVRQKPRSPRKSKN
ncbi:velvet factor-domain-containing protein [Mycena albidolilacea]|uniref:Velvet factor-domain-containing protein n=1 Tax=Mycena albidolilacea TaxID=1033008 RepID=A0AAD7EPU9_9AGAR|nr:velvet factor-domain-containing protein [Mycena albidolilacea]